ncbi:centrosome-associated protein ALMS1-like [Leucoraja erinacea]|uniref:centrosome-associated protein ALMS1-like n=1 Tax=Leucoraja erinaceus TaxID=7782 RepID=UPI002455849A|nr:centrosome-associated protein ALMS1-like [Leucoraja erinacea]
MRAPRGLDEVWRLSWSLVSQPTNPRPPPLLVHHVRLCGRSGPPAVPPSRWSPGGASTQENTVGNQGVQAGSLEIVPEATRRHTRDVGVTFPSPDSDVSLHKGGEQRDRTDTWPRGKGRGSSLGNKPSKRNPAVAWYIPAVELQEDWRKENVPEPRQRWCEAWGRRDEVPRRWREPLRQRQLQEAWSSEDGHEQQGGWAPRKTISSLVPISLGDALNMNRPWFISHSRERVRRLALLKEERKFQNHLQSERDQLFNRPPAQGHQQRRGPQPDDPVFYKKKISRHEMWDRSKRLYEQLPEVTRRKEEEKRRSESRSNRLRAQLYKQKITNRVLGRKVSWQ